MPGVPFQGGAKWHKFMLEGPTERRPTDKKYRGREIAAGGEKSMRSKKRSPVKKVLCESSRLGRHSAGGRRVGAGRGGATEPNVTPLAEPLHKEISTVLFQDHEVDY